MTTVQLTAYTVLDRVQWQATAFEATETGRAWTVIAQGLEELPAWAQSDVDVAWIAAQALAEECVRRSSSSRSQ